MISKVILILLVFSVPAQADEKKIADITSYVTVFTQIGLDTFRSLRSDNKKKELIQQGIRTGSTIGLSELVKALVHEERPDHSDNKSFWSEHSALGCTATSLKTSDGWQFKLGIALAIGTPVGRVVGEKHHWWDTAVGCGVGLGINSLVEKGIK